MGEHWGNIAAIHGLISLWNFSPIAAFGGSPGIEAALTQYNGGTGTPAEVWTYKHDAFGREVEVGQDAGGNVRVTTTAYDAERRVKRIVTPGGAIHLLATDSAGSVFTCHPTAGPPE